MEQLIFSVNVVLPVFILIVTGYVMTQIKLWDKHFTSAANRVCFRFFIPVLLFMNIYNTNIKELFNIKLIAFAVGGVLITILLAVVFVMGLVKENNKRGVLVQALFRSNIILFGIPIANNIFGDRGAGTASVVIAFIVPLYNLFAVIILSVFSEKTSKSIRHVIKDIAKNPLIIGSVLGIAAAGFKIPIPGVLQKTLKDLAVIGAPFALLILGAEFEIRALKKNIKYMAAAVFGKLIVVPAVMVGAAVLVGFRSYELVALLATFASPVAVNSYIMAQQAGADGELAGQLVIISTLFSPLSLCLFIYLFKVMGFIG